MLVGMWLPYSPIGVWLRFVPLPLLYWPLLVITLLLYVVLTQVLKVWLIRNLWI
jgi:P-type Mg2+ transporter